MTWQTFIDKITLGMSFLIWVISNARIILLPTVSRIKKLIPNAFYEINISEIMIFRLYTVYKKQEMIKIGNPTREKSQVLE